MYLDTPILETIKTMLSVDSDLDVFDQELLILINTTFPALNQLGVQTAKNFTIDRNSKWTDLIAVENLVSIQAYIFYKVKMIFDPPPTASLQSAYERMIAETEWRLTLDAEKEANNG